MLRRALIRGEVLLLALLVVATPLMLLARPSFRTHWKCEGMCCRPRKSLPAPALPDSRFSHEAKLTCQRGVATHIAKCISPSGTHDRQGVVAPLPPAILAEPDTLEGPKWIDDHWPDSHLAQAGFASIPFEPPRS